MDKASNWRAKEEGIWASKYGAEHYWVRSLLPERPGGCFAQKTPDPFFRVSVSTFPELKTERRYTNLSAAEVRQALLDRGYSAEEVPSERTMRDILNRMNYRLKRIQKGKPLKKTKDTDAIFENVKAVRAEAEADPETLEISIDTKTKVKLGEYDQGGKNANRSSRQCAQGARS